MLDIIFTMKIYKIIPSIIIIIILIVILTTNVLVIATDTSEGTPGVDMAAMLNVSNGFTWIYPGSSTNAQGETLHNIYLNDPNDPYNAAANIIKYTYNTKPNLIITINNNAAERILGYDIVDNIREYDWGQGMSRGDAAEQAMSNVHVNYFGIIESLFMGDISFHWV